MVSREMGVNLPATLVFDYPTVGALAKYVELLLHPRDDAASAPDTAVVVTSDSFKGEGVFTQVL